MLEQHSREAICNTASFRTFSHLKSYLNDNNKDKLISQRLTKVRVVPLIKEQLVADSLHDDVPGVD